MRFRGIHQILPNLTANDAIGEYALLLQRIWRRWGVESRLYVERTNVPHVEVLPLHRIPPRLSSEEVLVYHHSIGSEAAQRYLDINGGTRVVAYHNITPPALLADVPYLAARASLGLSQLKALARVSDLGLAPSEFNRRDLIAAGFPHVEVVHLAIAPERRQGLEKAQCDRSVLPRAAEGPVFLHVGRILPHKAIDDLLHTFATYTRTCNAAATLRIVGDTSEAPEYVNYLGDLINRYALHGASITGRVPAEQLYAEFGRADVYLCTSRHEGFCVPLVECMFAHVPVLAVAAGAVPEIARSCSVVLEERDPRILAEAAHHLIADKMLRRQVLQHQALRAFHFTEAVLEQNLLPVFQRLRTPGSCKAGAAGKPLE